MLRETAGRPAKTVKHLKRLGDEVVKIVQDKSELAPNPGDKRFQDPTFQRNRLYKGAMQYYLAVQKGVGEWLQDLDLDEMERAREFRSANDFGQRCAHQHADWQSLRVEARL
jgi:polyhydroxyalkanoate synthase